MDAGTYAGINEQQRKGSKPMSPFDHNKGWTVFEKKTGSSYDKYDTQLAIIVAKSKEPSHLYLSKLAVQKLGYPTHIVIRVNGTEIGFEPNDGKDGNAYVVNYSNNGENGKKESQHPFISCKAMISKMDLRSGKYDAHMWENPPNKMIVINSNDPPSRL